MLVMAEMAALVHPEAQGPLGLLAKMDSPEKKILVAIDKVVLVVVVLSQEAIWVVKVAGVANVVLRARRMCHPAAIPITR